MTSYKKVGLLGGSFNPAHEGHVHISRQAAERLELDEVWWLVSPQNPLKSTTGMAPLAERVNSAQALCQDSFMKVSTIESDLGTQYTIDAIKYLQNTYKDTRFIWLMGADNLIECHKWKDWQNIFASIPIAVIDREPYHDEAFASEAAQKFKLNLMDEKKAEQAIESNPPAWVYLHIPTHPASSTSIRENN